MKREVEVDTVPVRQGQRPEYQEAGLLGLAGWGALRPRDCMGDGGLSAQGTRVLKQPRLCLSLRTLSLCSHGALVGKQTDRDPNRAWAPTGQTPNDEHGQLRVDRKWRSYEWRNWFNGWERSDLHKQALSMNRVQKASLVSADIYCSKVWVSKTPLF